MEKVGKGFLKAEDVVEVVTSPELQTIFTLKGITKASISVKTALCWLKKLGWRYGKLKNGIYLDGHPCPNGFPVPGAIGCFCLVLITHDKSTFFQNDEHNTG